VWAKKINQSINREKSGKRSNEKNRVRGEGRGRSEGGIFTGATQPLKRGKGNSRTTENRSRETQKGQIKRT